MTSLTQKHIGVKNLLRIKKRREKGDKHAVSRISCFYRVPVKTAYDLIGYINGMVHGKAYSLSHIDHIPNQMPIL